MTLEIDEYRSIALDCCRQAQSSTPKTLTGGEAGKELCRSRRKTVEALHAIPCCLLMRAPACPPPSSPSSRRLSRKREVRCARGRSRSAKGSANVLRGQAQLEQRK